MTIIQAPHPTLRTKATEVDLADQAQLNFLEKLAETLLDANDPPGVGLAAPQVNASLRVFATAFGDEEKQRNVRIFINPVVVDQSSTQSLGKDPDDPDLEGCLSIKGIYAPVPRYTSITYQFLELEDNNWREKTETFYDFPARVMQHEFDHLEGILFTDYVLKYELPAHMSDAKTDKLVPIKHDILEMF